MLDLLATVGLFPRAAAESRPGRALGAFGRPGRMGACLTAAIPVALALFSADPAHNRHFGLLAERGVLGLAAFALLVALPVGAAATASGTLAMGGVPAAGFAAGRFSLHRGDN